MSQTVAKDTVIKVLRKRYDFQSARSVLTQAQKVAGLEAKSEFSGSDLGAVADVLEATSTRASEVIAALRALNAPKAAAKPAATPAAKPAADAKKPADDAKNPAADAKKPMGKKQNSKK